MFYKHALSSYIRLFSKKHIKETKVKFKISSSIVNAYRRQVQKMVERTESQTDTETQHLNLICSTLMHNFSSISQNSVFPKTITNYGICWNLAAFWFLQNGVWHLCNLANLARKWLLLSTLLLMATQAILKLLMVFSVLRHQNETDHANFFKIWDIWWIGVCMILRRTGT